MKSSKQRLFKKMAEMHTRGDLLEVANNFKLDKTSDNVWTVSCFIKDLDTDVFVRQQVRVIDVVTLARELLWTMHQATITDIETERSTDGQQGQTITVYGGVQAAPPRKPLSWEDIGITV